MLAVLVLPGTLAGAAADGGPPARAPSPWDGPWDAPVPEEAVQRFLARWKPRLLDPAWLQGYVEREGIPEGLEAEGFHGPGLDARGRMYLVHRLFQNLHATEPAFRASLEALGPEGARERLHEMQDMAMLLVFGKDALRRALREEGAAPQDAGAAGGAGSSEGESLLGRLRVPGALGLPEVEGVASRSLAPPEPQVVGADELHARQPPLTASPAPAAAPASPPTPLAVPVQATAGQGAPAIVQLPFEEPAKLPGTLRGAVDAALYRMCVEAAAEASCSDDVPLGTPVLLDATGDGVPDVAAQLALLPALRVENLPSARRLLPPGELVCTPPLAAGPAELEEVCSPVRPPTPPPLPAGACTPPVAAQPVELSPVCTPLPSLPLPAEASCTPPVLAGPAELAEMCSPAPVPSVARLFPSEGRCTPAAVAGPVELDPVCVSIPQPSAERLPALPDATLPPAPEPPPPPSAKLGAGFRLQVARLDVLAACALPAHVFAVLDVPQAGKRLALGVDGRPSSLAPETLLEFALPDLAAAQAGDVQALATLTHRAPCAASGVTLTVKDLSPEGEESDPLLASLTFEPVPERFALEARLRRQAGEESFDLEGSSSVRSRVEGSLVAEDTGKRQLRQFRAVFDQLPTQFHLALAARGGETTTFAYEGKEEVERVELAQRLTPDAARPGSFQRIAAEFRQIPNAVGFVFTRPFRLEYRASAPVGEASARIDEVEDGALQRSLTGLARGIPAQVLLEAETSPGATVLTYQASDVLPLLQVGLREPGNANTVVDAEARDLPTRMQVVAEGQAVTFVADRPVGVVRARLSRNGGAAGTDARDHAFVVQRGEALGVSAQLSGLKELAVDARDGGRFRVALEPGGQPFVAAANLEDELLASLEVAALPSSLALALRPGGDGFTYEASGVVPAVRAQLQQVSKGLFALAELDDIPARVRVDFEAGPEPVAEYEASDVLGRLRVFLREAPGGPTLDATILALPPFLRIEAADGRFRLDARSAAAAPPASAEIGSILLRFATDGLFLEGAPAEDHLLLQQRGGLTRAELLYRGLRAVSLATQGEAFEAAVQNSAPRVFVAQVDLPAMLLTARIDEVPARVAVRVNGTSLQYRASSPINATALRVDPRDGQILSAVVRGLPDAFDLTIDLERQLVAWEASAPVERVTVTARALALGRTWDALLDLEGIPARWTLGFQGDHAFFRAESGPLGSVLAQLTNHGAVTSFEGNHASVVFRSPDAALDATDDLDVSFRVSQVRLAEFQRSPSGFRADLRMGGGEPFLLHANVSVGADRAFARAVLDPLPTSIQVSQEGAVLRYAADANFDLRAFAEAGNAAAIANTPEPPEVLGLAVRDGRGCTPAGDAALCGTAVKARLLLLGFPKGLTLDAPNRTLSVNEFSPPAGSNALALDAELDDLVRTPIDLLAVQRGIPRSINFTLGPFVTEDLPEGRRTSLSYTASAALGPFTADVTVGKVAARVEVSNIPASVSVSTLVGRQATNASLATSEGISRVFVGVRLAASSGSFAAGLELLQIPTRVNLSFGRVQASVGGDVLTAPGLRYEADADTLDIRAFVDAALFNDIRAQVRLIVDDLGRSTTAALAGRELVLTSSPSTRNLEVHVSAELRFSRDFAGCVPSSCPRNRLDFSGHVRLLPLTINDLRLRIADFSSVRVRLGITTSIEGTYSLFDLGWQSITAFLDVEAQLRVCWDFRITDGCATLASFTFHPGTITLDVFFRVATNHSGRFLRVCLGIVEVTVDIQPHPHFTSRNGFAVSSSAAEGGAFLVTPNPLGILPDAVVDIVAALQSPLGGGFGLDVDLGC